MDKKQKEAAGEQYNNKVVWNQSGASYEIDNSTGLQGIAETHMSGSNRKVTAAVTSEYAVNNKQTEVVNDSFETIRNNKNTYTGGDRVDRVNGSLIRQQGYNSPDQIEALKEWKEAYKPIAERNSMFDVQRGGYSYPNGVAQTENGTRERNPTRNQELYRNRVSPDGPPMTMPLETPVVGDGVNQVATMEGFESPIPQFEVANPNEEDYGEAESPSTENGVYPPTSEKANLPNDIKRLQKEKLTDIELRIRGEGPTPSGNVQEITFGNVVIQVGAAFNEFPSIRTDPKGRAQPGSLQVGVKGGAYSNVESVPNTQQVDNAHGFPVGNRTTTVGNRDVLMVGSGGILTQTTGGIEVGATSYNLGANIVNINSQDGVYIDSPSLVQIRSRSNVSIFSNKQVYIEPSLGVKNNIKVGGSAYIQGETYLHHVTAPQEIQTTAEMILLGKLLEGMSFNCKHTFGTGSSTKASGKITLTADSNTKVECDPHAHNFYNLPLTLTNTADDVAVVAEGENINVDGLNAPAKAVANGGSGANDQTSMPSAPRELVKEALNTLIPHNRDLVTSAGYMKPPLPQVEKFGSFAEEQLIQPTFDNTA